ncbi:aKG-HExxH-type peptide beta-hydroxylase [Streptomyces sp. NBC_00690]|uniref:aKG-HExxH-type peptide beta-hydroxylase n=1 Tax=Streptomyces sp. NBC_00690 TaxID=2975808 RepID=UPI002E2A4E55|nr:HEXXH motif-containing putative peptide modification protein [Streptomyces sp. NBC_00690]
MHVEPDAVDAVDERIGLLKLLRDVLERAGLVPPSDDRLHHPAAVDAVHTAQRALRSGRLDDDRRQSVQDVLDRLPPPAFGPAAPQSHLHRSVMRALRSIPPRQDADGAPVTIDIAPWRPAEHEVLNRTVTLLDRIWPESLAELRATVMEIALLTGNAINGYTDFTVHGTVLINRTRLTDAADGLPGPVRFAEALVHEGAHTRCNAAAVADPFLQPEPAADSGPSSGHVLVATPLRADFRPLSGLFQQTVVLARSVQLYRRLDDHHPAIDTRRTRLLDSADQAVTTLTAHTGALTPRGRKVLAECAAVLGSQR